MTRSLTRRARAAAALILGATTLLTLTGCNQLDSFTGDQSMRWVGHTMLPKTSVRAAQYRASALLPDLSAPQAAKALGENPAEATPVPDGLAAKGWSVIVRQSPFTTSVQFARPCQQQVSDKAEVIAAGKKALSALGGDGAGWGWFTVTDSAGAVRAIAEPKIEGHQTWATGTMAVLVDQSGVCAVKASLMRFSKTGKVERLGSAYDTFQSARHTRGRVIAGDYRSFEPTWTLLRDGLLVPLWRFSAKDHAIVVVDLGDGLETALDTESVLRQNAKGHNTPTSN